MFVPVTGSLLLGALVSLPSASAFVFELPIWFRNSYALVEVAVGTPHHPHLLLFDTSSSTTWFIDSAGANGDDNLSGFHRNGYDVNASTTSRRLNTSTDFEFLGGATEGFGVSDLFSFPDSGRPSNISWIQTFVAANASSWTWLPGDGFLGLAFGSLAEASTLTVMETLMRQTALIGLGRAPLIDQPRFGIYFGKELNDTGASAGSGNLAVGFSEEEKYAIQGLLNWAPVQKVSTPMLCEPDEYQLWRSQLSYFRGIGYASNGSVISNRGLGFEDDTLVEFSTGAAGITVPPSTVKGLYEAMGMNYTAIMRGDHEPKCSEFNDSWAVEFQFGPSDNPAAVSLTGDQLARPGFHGKDTLCFPPFDEGDVEGLFVFGKAFLAQLYTVWDFGAFDEDDYAPRVGFGQLKKEYRPKKFKGVGGSTRTDHYSDKLRRGRGVKRGQDMRKC